MIDKDQLRVRAEKILASKVHASDNASAYVTILDENESALRAITIELQQDLLQKKLQEIQDEKEKFTSLTQFLPMGYITLDANGVICEINEKCAHLFGLSKQRLLNKSLSRYVAPDYQFLFSQNRLSCLQKDHVGSFELKLLKRGGPLFFVKVEMKVILSQHDGQKQILMLIHEMNESQRVDEIISDYQNKMTQAERNISIEKLVTVIAHELNHPLSVQANYLHGCIRRLESGDFQVGDILSALQHAAEQSHRAAEIVLRMKNFNCKGLLHFETVCINSLITETIQLIQYEIMQHYPIKITYQVNKNIAPLYVDKIHIQQVILNIARNAVEAMFDAKVDEPKLIIEVNIIKKNCMEICISNNGPSICAGDLYQLFNPYFTTKPYGIGLGLAVSLSIVEAHKGKLTTESNVLGYTCFKIMLTSAPSTTPAKEPLRKPISKAKVPPMI